MPGVADSGGYDVAKPGFSVATPTLVWSLNVAIVSDVGFRVWA